MDDNELYLLEESLWKTETRFDEEYMESILDINFREFGWSGQNYNRGQMLFSSDQKVDIKAGFPLRNFKTQCLSKDVFLVTYISEVTYGDGVRLGNRSSIWKQVGTAWKLMFHQGTPFT
ncbi:MAG: DUF4440 domain-containing protein [Litorimonas sp.]